MPTRWVSGTSRTSRVRSMARLSRALPSAARCERPSEAPRSASSDQPGGLAQGPEEKRGLVGRVAGMVGAMVLPFQISAPSLGRGVPPRDMPRLPAFRKPGFRARGRSRAALGPGVVHHRKPDALLRRPRRRHPDRRPRPPPAPHVPPGRPRGPLGRRAGALALGGGGGRGASALGARQPVGRLGGAPGRGGGPAGAARGAIAASACSSPTWTPR